MQGLRSEISVFCCQSIGLFRSGPMLPSNNPGWPCNMAEKGQAKGDEKLKGGNSENTRSMGLTSNHVVMVKVWSGVGRVAASCEVVARQGNRSHLQQARLPAIQVNTTSFCIVKHLVQCCPSRFRALQDASHGLGEYEAEGSPRFEPKDGGPYAVRTWSSTPPSVVRPERGICRQILMRLAPPTCFASSLSLAFFTYAMSCDLLYFHCVGVAWRVLEAPASLQSVRSYSRTAVRICPISISDASNTRYEAPLGHN
ncbi:hypothetical protein BDV96DRAFT_196346 [Lophiotrema nucula]|uniref:Uncharacterized protein n=1 Tax=Lophiotrema nucula TaxID=690887 RepID=A0A6A5YU13_9PLEO|nr:hypothetical protein BDV96DRAFT_196346 [Lophiotrema nucula]